MFLCVNPTYGVLQYSIINMHRHGERSVHTGMGIGVYTQAWGKECTHRYGERSVHTSMGIGVYTQVWG